MNAFECIQSIYIQSETLRWNFQLHFFRNVLQKPILNAWISASKQMKIDAFQLMIVLANNRHFDSWNET